MGVCVRGGRGSGINGPTSLSHRGGVSRSRLQECGVCEVEVGRSTHEIVFVIEVAVTFWNPPSAASSGSGRKREPLVLPSAALSSPFCSDLPSIQEIKPTSDLKISEIL